MHSLYMHFTDNFMKATLSMEVMSQVTHQRGYARITNSTVKKYSCSTE